MRIAPFVFLLLASASLRAEEVAAPDQEKLGLELFRQERYADAIPHLEQAAATRHEARIRLTLGEAYRKVHDYRNAIASYQRVLTLEPPADLVELANAGLEAATLEDVQWRRVHPGDRERGAAPLALAPARATEPPSGRQAMTAPFVAAPPSAVVQQSAPPIADRSALRTSGWATLGLGVVAAGTGTLFGLQAKSAAADWAAATDTAALRSARDQADSKAKLATISFIAAGALVAGGLAILLLSSP